MSFKVSSFNEWTTDVFDEKTISNVINLKKHDQNQFDDSFYKNLEFGTGGMRGICLLYTSPSPRDRYGSRMPSSA